MTAKELIAILNTVDPEARVIIPGYDIRMTDIGAILYMDVNLDDDEGYDYPEGYNHCPAGNYVEAEPYSEKPPRETNVISLRFYATYWQKPKVINPN